MTRRSLLITLVLALLPAQAEAFSLQVHGGGGYEAKYNGQYTQAGLTAFVYEAQTFDLFVGADLTQADLRDVGDWGLASFAYDVSGKVTGVGGGVRFKYPTQGRVKPYLSAGVLWAKAEYDLKAPTGFAPTPSQPDSAVSFTFRAALGTEIGLGAQTSLGLEAGFSGIMPGYGTFSSRARGGAVWLMGLNLGYRYYF